MREISAFQAVPSGGTGTVITPDATVAHTLHNGGDAVTVNAGTGTLTPKVPGRWLLLVRGSWAFPAATEYGHQLGYRWNGTTDFWEHQGTVNALAHLAGAPGGFTAELTFNGTTDEVRIIGYQSRGADVNLTLRSCVLRYLGT